LDRGSGMLKPIMAITGLIVVISVAAGVGSKLATGKGGVEFMAGPRIDPMEFMLRFDIAQPADEIKDLI